MNIVQIQSRVQELPNSAQTMQYLNAAMNGQVTTVPPYIAAAELKRRETEGMMDQLAKGAAQAQQTTVKDQLQQKMGIMALMGQQQPPQPPQIPQPAPPEQQPQAGGIDSLPVRDDMFGMAGGGIVSFSGDSPVGSSVPDPMARQPGETADDYRFRLIQMAAEKNKRPSPVMSERAREAEKILLPSLNPSTARPSQGIVAATGGASTGEQDAINAALKAVGASTSKLPAMAPAVKPAAAAKPPGPRPLAAARPPADGGINLADQAPGASPTALADALDMDPAMQRMKKLAEAQNPYGGTQESQEDYIKRVRQGILSQIPGGKTPYETSEARLKEIEARRAKEDTDYADSNKGRQLDNLLTMISGMGRGSFGNAGMQGIQAVQKVERSQREEDLKRKDMRDQQSMKLMEIRSLNDQAQYAEATGNVKEFERLKQEIKKLQNEYTFKQADLNKELATLGSTARGKDSDTAANKEKLRVESRDREEERKKDVQIARIQAAARNMGRGDMTPAQAAQIRDRAEDNIAAREKGSTRLAADYRKNPQARADAVEAETNRLLQGQGYTSGSPPPKPGSGAAPAGFTVQRDPK
jgi:hypothetical protein